jgi:hypothetical protein
VTSHATFVLLLIVISLVGSFFAGPSCFWLQVVQNLVFEYQQACKKILIQQLLK